MRHVVVVSHTYVEPENRGKLRALARLGPVTAVVPRRWHDRALGQVWRTAGPVHDDGVMITPATWWGPKHPSLGGMVVPRSVALGEAMLLQVEEEPWSMAAFLGMRGWGAPTILFTWENLERRFPWPWSQLRHGVLKRVDGLIAGSTRAAAVARAQGYAGPVAVIPQLGVELPRLEPPTPADRLRVAYVGRLVPEKGVDLLLEALRPLEVPWQARIIGDGPLRGSLERLAYDLGIGDRVAFVGSVPHASVAGMWRDADICVLPSRSSPGWTEQLGHVLLEAMAHGVAVVGSRSGAIPEVIGGAGRLFQEADVDGLTAALHGLAVNPERRHELAAAGRRRVEEQFTNERIAARTRDFHDDVCKRLRDH